jgi:hypothetical protein
MSGVKQFIETSQAEDKPFCMVIASVHAHHPWTIGDVSNFPLDKIVVPPHMVDGPVTRECLAKHAAEVEDLDDQVGATMKLLDDMKLNCRTVNGRSMIMEQRLYVWCAGRGKLSLLSQTRLLCIVILFLL